MQPNTGIKLEALLDEMQVAAMLSLSVRTLQAWRVKGEGPPFVRLGRAVRYRHGDLLAWLDANRVATVPSSPVLHKVANTAPSAGCHHVE